MGIVSLFTGIRSKLIAIFVLIKAVPLLLAASALGLAAAKADRLILLDISMPGLSGEETCRALRAGGASGTLIVAYTAHAFADERRRILAAGFDDIPAKPVNLQSMAELMQRLSL